jgi:hypothetical protein
MSETFEPGETARNFGYALLIWICAGKLACAAAARGKIEEREDEEVCRLQYRNVPRKNRNLADPILLYYYLLLRILRISVSCMSHELI